MIVLAGEVKQHVARRLLEVKAIKFDLKEGWKLKIHDTFPDAPPSPFYIDLRIVRSYPDLLGSITDLLEEKLHEIDVRIYSLSDVPTAATPLVAVLSWKMAIPMISPRLDAKTHGLQRDIDGVWQPGDRVVVVDDLRTTGGSKEEVINLYKGKGLLCVAVVVLVDRGDENNPLVANLPLLRVYRWSELLAFYKEEGMISGELYTSSRDYPSTLNAYVREHS